MVRRLTAVLVATLVLLAPVGVNAAFASGSDTSSQAANAALVSKAKAADAAGYMVVQRSQAQHVGSAVFYPTGPIGSSTLVVIAQPDGSLPGGLTTAQLKASVQASRAATAPLATVTPQSSTYGWNAGFSWSSPFYGGAWIGLSSSAQASYTFSTNCGCETGNGQGLGYYRGYLGSVYGTWGKYYYIGQSNGSDVGRAVPWGAVAANREFEGLCVISNIGHCYGTFY